jgi:hypothetical protein
MRSGTILPREAFDTLDDDERREFEIKAMDEAYAIEELLERRDGGSSGSGRHLLLGDPMDFIPRAVKRLREDRRTYDLKEVDDLVKLFASAVARLMKDRIRDIRGDTRKVLHLDPQSKIKLIRSHRPGGTNVIYQRDTEDETNAVFFDVLPEDPILVHAIELSDKTIQDRFLRLLVSRIKTLGSPWSDRLSRIFQLCLEWPEQWKELITVTNGNMSFKVKRIAFVLKEKPQDISNALRHLDNLAIELGDPEFEELIAKAAATAIRE